MAMLVYGDWFHHVCIVVADGAVQASNPCGGVGGLGDGLVPPGGDVVVVVVDGGGRLRLGWTTPPVDALVSGPELGANEARTVCAVASLGPKLSVARTPAPRTRASSSRAWPGGGLSSTVRPLALTDVAGAVLGATVPSSASSSTASVRPTSAAGQSMSAPGWPR